MDERNIGISPLGRPRAAASLFFAALAALLLLSACGQEGPKDSYNLLGIQDYSHGRVGRFSARVAVREDFPKEMVRLVVRDVVAKMVEENRADVCWVLIHKGEPPTMDNLLASAQWVSPSLPDEDKPFVEVSSDATSYAGAPIYITWP
jgi:hypothetical protein